VTHVPALHKLRHSHKIRHGARFLGLALLLPVHLMSFAHADETGPAVFRDSIQPLLARYCIRCHGPKEQAGDLRIDQLDRDLLRGKDADFWHEVLNQLNEGKMPPKDERQLPAKELIKITTWLEAELKKAAALRNSTGGRQLMRRMSRYEYQYTLQDLLGISLDYSADVPGDLTGEDGLKTNASRLGMSLVQMQSYLDVAERALAEAIPDGPETVFKEETKKISVTTVRGQRRIKSNKGKKSRYIAPSPGLTKSSFFHDLPRKVTFTKRPFAGRFRLRVRVIGKAASDGRLPELMAQVGHRASGDYDPKKIMGRRMIKADGSPQIVEFTGNIEDFPLGKKGAYYNGSGSHDVTHLSVWLWNTTFAKSKIKADTKIEDLDEPLLEVLSVEFEGPLLEGYPSQTAKDLLPASENEGNEDEYAVEVLRAFLKRAYRREVTAAEVAHATDSFHAFRKLTGDFKSALRSTLAMLLVSPKFIYLIEPSAGNERARELTAYELATRLSYFLWASMPDEELLAIAASGELLKRNVLQSQVIRMRKDPKFERFVKHFTSQWLGLSAMDNVAVNPSAFPSFSDEIRENLKLETMAFAKHVFTKDLSCRNFINSDFAMLNQVVARHYGIANVYGSHFRPVSLSGDSHRGGVLTQGSFMIIGSDGTESNPIYRGVWLQKRVFANPPPPPPPGAPPLDKSNPELNTLTLKEQIELHRKAPACARCHNGIDPWGIAFENYDATGRWRTTITRKRLKGTAKPEVLAVDATSRLPSGQELVGMTGLKHHILTNKSTELADALTRRVAGYALGRQLEFSDDQMVKRLTASFEKSDFRIGTLIDGVVTSRAFLTK
jgi:hypothetical protein